MNGDEGPRERRVAWEEERLALLDHARELVADGVDSEVGSVVAHAHHDRRSLVVAAAGAAEIKAYELNHVWLQQVDIPPRSCN